MSDIKKLLFTAFIAPFLCGPLSHAAEFEVLDRFSVDGYAVLRGSADIPGGSFTVGGSTFVVKDGNVGVGTESPAHRLHVAGSAIVTSSMSVSGTGLAGTTPVFQVIGGTMSVLANGNVGIGTEEPGARLDVGGGVKVANDVGECNLAKAGTIRFTGTNFQGCTGAAWLTLENSPPSVASVTPDNGAMGGLYAITITGSGFGAPAVITIGGNTATNVTTVSGTQITATVPANASSGAKDVVVRNPDGLLSTFAGGFRYNPGVTGVSPGNGPVNAGTNITITGAGFVSGAAITINNVSAANVAWTSASQLTATTPADTVSGGAKDVKVTNPDAGYGVLTSGYRYDPVITSVSPGNGPINAGTVLTIAGKGFITGATVKINEVSAAGAAVNSDIQMTATTPANTVSGGAKNVKVTNSDAGYGVLTGGYRYDPVVTGVNPTAGATRGSYTITLTGAGFIATPSVTVGGFTATGVSVGGDTTLTATVPANQLAAGAKNITVTNTIGGAGTLTGQFTAQPSGESQANAGLSCKGIIDTVGGSVNDGVYWIDPDGGLTTNAFDVFCDMTTAGGGWTVCYNHYITDPEEMTGSTVVNMTTQWGTAGSANEYGRNCVGAGHTLQPTATRFTANGGNAWIQANSPPDSFYDFFKCGSSGSASITTWGGGTYTRNYGVHDCPNLGADAINQIAAATNSQTCFEHNSKNGDSNHHWAMWSNCAGSYVNGTTPDHTRTGWARVMMR